MLFMNRMGFLMFMAGSEGGSKSSRGWLMTAVSPWGENAEDEEFEEFVRTERKRREPLLN